MTIISLSKARTSLFPRANICDAQANGRYFSLKKNDDSQNFFQLTKDQLKHLFHLTHIYNKELDCFLKHYAISFVPR